MKSWYIPLVLIAALLLVGGAGAVKPDRGPVEKAVFVHYRDAGARPAQGGSSSSMFELWGYTWNSQNLPITFNVDPANPYVSDLGAVTANLKASFTAWDAKTSRALFRFGQTVSSPAEANGKNDIYFTPIDLDGVIAMTTVWYYDDGSGEIVEADIQMNTNMRWGIDADGEGKKAVLRGAYDIRNIATHEVGHVCGLADLYDPVTREMTMYGYGGEGEVKKISLAAGDVAGLRTVYGA